jgi:hypothetical protein
MRAWMGCRLVWTNIHAALAAAGLGPANLVKGPRTGLLHRRPDPTLACSTAGLLQRWQAR